ncbi:Hypothetical predicted protein [Octopus vulgaris]|uniref:Uncharacterized protein n=1 Tax=Octopus vulgaris TaxID=6645 RepID=A0AA36BT00_OCTVU|nr:Hypothetical predicted protein [Octopus vulgaris]
MISDSSGGGGRGGRGCGGCGEGMAAGEYDFAIADTKHHRQLQEWQRTMEVRYTQMIILNSTPVVDR